MITKFKIFENTYINYGTINNASQSKVILTSVRSILFYLEADYEWFEKPYGLYSNYDIDVIDFFKEIFLGKNITFKSINNIEDQEDPIKIGVVEDISLYLYQDEFFLKFYINSNKSYLVKTSYPITMKIEDYDAENKPLHKEVKLKKQVEKYNL